jgi:hypothetical protein
VCLVLSVPSFAFFQSLEYMSARRMQHSSTRRQNKLVSSGVYFGGNSGGMTELGGVWPGRELNKI